MTMSRKQPSAPFVTVTIYSTGPEDKTFDATKGILGEIGSSTGIVSVVSVENSSIGRPLDAANAGNMRAESVTEDFRIVGELFQLPRMGPAYCEYARRWSDQERCPVAVNMSGEELGMPIEYLDKKQIALANKRQEFAKKLLRRMSTISGVLYGSIDIEQAVPTPSALDSVPLPLDLYISNLLLDPEVLEKLGLLYGAVNGTQTSWEDGIFYSPFSSIRLRDPRGRRNVTHLAELITPVVADAVHRWLNRD
ncbi:hypothetical protein [Nocardia salmonicida]|uniref:hypothetical protein n=1 Tax=Nocardia salmonicida TaxID=53431 RepID=UPI0033CE912B